MDDWTPPARTAIAACDTRSPPPGTAPAHGGLPGTGTPRLAATGATAGGGGAHVHCGSPQPLCDTASSAGGDGANPLSLLDAGARLAAPPDRPPMRDA